MSTGRTSKTDRSAASILIVALSGLGKSTLTRDRPTLVLDADNFLYAAVAEGFPDLEPRARLMAWRDLCQQRPWTRGGETLARWAAIRRGWVEPFVDALRRCTHPLVVTSLLDPPWVVSTYYGVERGRYLEHLRLAGRLADNSQSEAMNDRLEGYSPLVRLAPGTFLASRPELLAVIDEHDRRR
ncbi:MAG: hypothetical protein R3F60_22085 [bacterium]